MCVLHAGLNDTARHTHTHTQIERERESETDMQTDAIEDKCFSILQIKNALCIPEREPRHNDKQKSPLTARGLTQTTAAVQPVSLELKLIYCYTATTHSLILIDRQTWRRQLAKCSILLSAATEVAHSLG